MEVFIFEGNALVEEAIEIDEWSEKCLLQVFEDYAGEGWMEDADECGTKNRDTFDMPSDNIAQAVADAHDGGMLYIVRK